MGKKVLVCGGGSFHRPLISVQRERFAPDFLPIPAGRHRDGVVDGDRSVLQFHLFDEGFNHGHDHASVL